MKPLAITVILIMALCAGAQSGSTYQEPSHQPVKIIHGPVVEFVTDSTAQIAWSTNENSGTVLHYGTDPDDLKDKASMPWGGITHRVLLKHLHSNTTYYFKAESPDGQDTGTRAEAPQASFKTQ
jgi:Purple acid Phosphatase, N-terminal domain